MNPFTRIWPSDFGPLSKHQTEADLKKTKDGKMNLIDEWNGKKSIKEKLCMCVHQGLIESVTLHKDTNELEVLLYEKTKLRYIQHE